MKPVQLPIDVRVRDTGGAYTTQTVAGQRASSTSSAEAAAGRLVDKLTQAMFLPIGSLSARRLPPADRPAGVSAWRIDVLQEFRS